MKEERGIYYRKHEERLVLKGNRFLISILDSVLSNSNLILAPTISLVPPSS